MGKSELETFMVLEGGQKWAGNLHGFKGISKSGLKTFMVLEGGLKMG